MTQALIGFDGPVWRLMVEGSADEPCAPVRSPEGRFHHAGQPAVYASLTAEGASVAIRRYLSDGVRRVLVPLWLKANAVADVQGNPAASIVWQDIAGSGEYAPTWRFSDLARQQGGQALLYSSRSRPDLSHVVVFEPGCLGFVGPISRYTP